MSFRIHFRFLFTLLLLFSSLLIFYNLGNSSLRNGDEALYATISQKVLDTGNWITPRTENGLFLEKPPLLFWLNAILFHFFGNSEWMIRFWSALAGVLCIAFTVLLGKELYGERAGLWAGFALATCVHFVYEHCAKTGEIDSLLLLFLISSFYFLIRSEEKPGFLFLSAVLIGFASLAKNFAGGLPFLISALYLAISGKWRSFGKAQLALAALLCLAIPLAWILPMLWIHGFQFAKVFFVWQFLDRAASDDFATGIKEARTLGGGFIFVIRTMWGGFYPWSALLLPAILFSIDRSRGWKTQRGLLAVVWILIYFAILLLFKNKLAWYVLPLYPAACLLVGKLISDLTSPHPISTKAALAGFFMLGALLFFVADPNYNPFQIRAAESRVNPLLFTGTPALAAALTVLCAGLWYILTRWSIRKAVIILIAGTAGYSILFAALPLRYSVNRAEIQDLAVVIEENAVAPVNTLYFWRLPHGIFYPSYPLWKPGKIAWWYFVNIPNTRFSFPSPRQDVLADLLKEGGNKMFIMTDTEYRHIQHLLPHKLLATRPVNEKMYILIRPLKQTLYSRKADAANLAGGSKTHAALNP